LIVLISLAISFAIFYFTSINTKDTNSLNSSIISSLVFLPDNKKKNYSITIKRNVSTDKTIQTLTGHTGGFRSLVVLPDGLLASGSLDSTIRIWNVTNGTCIKTLVGHSDYVTSLVILPNGLLKSGSYDNTIRIWNVNTGITKKTLTGHTDYVSLSYFIR